MTAGSSAPCLNPTARSARTQGGKLQACTQTPRHAEWRRILPRRPRNPGSADWHCQLLTAGSRRMHAVPVAHMRAAGQAGLGHDGVCALELSAVAPLLPACLRDANYQPRGAAHPLLIDSLSTGRLLNGTHGRPWTRTPRGAHAT